MFHRNVPEIALCMSMPDIVAAVGLMKVVLL